jgi:hypothetical protein
MIISRTYPTVAGNNFIEDPELVFTDIYKVKKEGLQYDLDYPGATNQRTYIYDSALGRIYWPISFNPGEKAFVIFKKSSGPVIPQTPVCEAAVIFPVSLADTINGSPYGNNIPITGTPPFVLTNVVKPAWMNLTVIPGVIQISGFSNVIGAASLSFDLENCDGAVASYSDTFTVLPAVTTFTIMNMVAGALINSLTNLSFVAQTGLIYPPPFQTLTGVHGAFTAPPVIDVTKGPFNFTMTFFINSIPIQAINVTSSGSYTFNLVTSFVEADDIQIQLS